MFSENVRGIVFTISAVALVLLFTARAKTASGLAFCRTERQAPPVLTSSVSRMDISLEF